LFIFIPFYQTLVIKKIAMKGKLLTLLLLSLIGGSLQAQVSLSATAGTGSGSYTTLGAAFTAINAGTHKGAITITLTGNTTETATANLDSSGNPATSSYTLVSIKPQANTAVTISGSVAGALINLNGADNVTFDGTNVGTASLTISNTDVTTGSSTVKFINDASFNHFFNLTIKGAAPTAATAASGTVFFSTGLLTGNDNNYFLNSNLDGTSNSSCLLFSGGSNATFAVENSNDSLVNCKIYDFFSTTVASPYGVLLNAGNTDWFISGNSFYQTVARTTALQGLPSSLTIFPTYTTDQHTVIGNYSGGSAANAVGLSSYTGTSTNAVGYIGINVQTGGPLNMVQNNTVQNVTVTYGAAAGSFSNAAFSAFIGGYDGTSTFTGNTVSNFSITNTAGTAAGSAMSFNGRVTAAGVTQKPVFTITNNTINNVTFNAGGTGSAQFFGIRLETSSGTALTTATTISNPYFIVSGNTITNLTSTAGGASGWIRGVGTVLTNGTSSTCPLFPKALIQNNSINNISCFAALANAATNTAVGIQFSGTANGTNITDTVLIKGNTIHTINSTNPADIASSVAGIIGTNGLYGITQNRIYNLLNASPGTTTIPMITGINIRASLGNTGAASYIANNFVSLGTGNTGNVSHFGILNNFSASNAINVYYNSVYIGGAAAAGTNNSAAFYRGSELFTGASLVTTTVDIKDNVFINLRSGSGGNYGVAAYSTGTWTSDYNDIYVGPLNAGNTAYYGATAYNLAGYQAAASSDANSKFVAVNFVAPATGDLHLTGTSNGDANLRGIVIPSVTIDYDGVARNGFNTYMGADEAAISLPIHLLAFNGQLKNNNAILSWSTSGEVNADRFELERSSNGTWIKFATVTAKGEASNTYQATDANLAVGKWQYRLKMIDKDGKFSYSQIVTLELSGKGLFALGQNYPNPVKGSTQLSYQITADSKVMIELFTNDGKKIATLVNQQQAIGSYNITVDVTKYGLASGNYIYRMIALDKNNQELFQSSKTITVVQ
jgi:hypothetical protein